MGIGTSSPCPAFCPRPQCLGTWNTPIPFSASRLFLKSIPARVADDAACGAHESLDCRCACEPRIPALVERHCPQGDDFIHVPPVLVRFLEDSVMRKRRLRHVYCIVCSQHLTTTKSPRGYVIVSPFFHFAFVLCSRLITLSVHPPGHGVLSFHAGFVAPRPLSVLPTGGVFTHRGFGRPHAPPHSPGAATTHSGGRVPRRRYRAGLRWSFSSTAAPGVDDATSSRKNIKFRRGDVALSAR